MCVFVLNLESISKDMCIVNELTTVNFMMSTNLNFDWLQCITNRYLFIGILSTVSVMTGTLSTETVILIPTLISGFGDGLAEPVGVRFGKRSYSVRALFTTQRFTRTLEGSACVLITGIIVLLMHAGELSGVQLIVGLLTIPLAMTLTEAYSPHSWDTPFLMLVGYGSLLCVLQLWAIQWPVLTLPNSTIWTPST